MRREQAFVLCAAKGRIEPNLACRRLDRLPASLARLLAKVNYGADQKRGLVLDLDFMKSAALSTSFILGAAKAYGHK
ncbi:hypothetical protein MGEO_03160 [Marivita geojedonensis]|uniref:Uncharacterized protein n=1 Tax=Marivita geojedonensis TaxID=1123756 RepID=A0A1X4NPB7_9RHOB|nr:hypothetical protein MGEO_03160 [Marivita geojedonensis]PRY73253.1 hypothetical protein CLV76_1315 [Marivita geojedonensis]